MREETEKRKGTMKLVLAVLQGDDYVDTVDELNRDGFSITILSSTGGFLKKKSVTIMIGVEESKLQTVLAILKRRAGNRQQLSYATMATGTSCPSVPLVPVQVRAGGAVVFVLDLEQFEKF